MRSYSVNRLLNPAVSRLDKIREKRIKKALIEDQFEPVEVGIKNCSLQNDTIK